MICRVLPTNIHGHQHSKNELQGALQDKAAHRNYRRTVVSVFSVYLEPQGIKLFWNKSSRLLGGWWGEDILVVSNGITHLWSGNYSSVCGHT